MMTSKQLVSAVVGSAVLGLGALTVGSIVPVGAFQDPPAEERSEDGCRPRRRLLAAAFETSAGVIGVEVDELRQAVAAGETVGEVATANGVDPQAVVDALVAAGEAAIDDAVADGRIDEARGEELEARLPDVAQRFVDHRRQE